MLQIPEKDLLQVVISWTLIDEVSINLNKITPCQEMFSVKCNRIIIFAEILINLVNDK